MDEPTWSNTEESRHAVLSTMYHYRSPRRINDAEIVEFQELDAKRQVWYRHRKQLYRQRSDELQKQAEQTLMAVLSPLQLHSYLTEQRIPVTGSDGGKYLIMTIGASGNVYRARRSQCAHINPDWGHLAVVDGYRRVIPLAEHHLAQLLMITTNEALWNRTAYGG